MRPDTEPNKHAKRIMAGAFALTIATLLVKGYFWLLANAKAIAIIGTGFVFVIIACYAIGTIALVMTPGEV